MTCASGRVKTGSQPTMVQVLHISNGETINKKLAQKDNRIEELLSAGKSDEQIVDEVYLSALARHPTDAERQQTLKVLAETQDANKRELVEDVYWSILSSREFLFNH